MGISESPLSAALAVSPFPEEHRCPFATFLHESPDRAALSDAIDKIRGQREVSKHNNGGYTARWLSDILRGNNHHWSKDQIQRHLNGSCGCRDAR